MIYPVDVLYADIGDSLITGKITNGTDEAITINPAGNEVSASITIPAGATVVVPVGTYMNGTNKITVAKGKTVNLAP